MNIAKVRDNTVTILGGLVIAICGYAYAYAEVRSNDQQPDKILTKEEVLTRDFSALPLSGKIEREIWQTKNWHMAEGGLAKRRDGHLAESEPSDLQNLSPVEKIDHCRKLRGLELKFTKEELAHIAGPCPSWAGECHNIRRIQYLRTEAPSPFLLDDLEISSQEAIALDCLYLDHHTNQNSDLYLSAGRRDAPRGTLINAGAFHLVLTKLIGQMGKSFIYIPEFFGVGREIYNELVLEYSSTIRKATPSSAEVYTKLRVLSEDPQGVDVIEERHLHYILDLEDNQIVGGFWLDAIGGPYIIWRPNSASDEKIKSGECIKDLLQEKENVGNC